jgi:hypothetical protein
MEAEWKGDRRSRRWQVLASVKRGPGRSYPGVYCLVIFVSASAGDNTTAAHSSTIPTTPLLRHFLTLRVPSILYSKYHRF